MAERNISAMAGSQEERLAAHELRARVEQSMDDLLLRCEELDDHLTGELITQGSDFVATREIPLANLVDLDYRHTFGVEDDTAHVWQTLQVKRPRVGVTFSDELDDLYNVRYVAAYKQFAHDKDGVNVLQGAMKVYFKGPQELPFVSGRINGEVKAGPLERAAMLKLYGDLYQALRAVESVSQEPEVMAEAPEAEVIALATLARLAAAKKEISPGEQQAA